MLTVKPPRRPLVVAWGGGVNSTAMLVEFAHLSVRPDLILFADTGAEKPETYAYRDLFAAWLRRQGFPELITVRNDGVYRTLEANCLATGTLPSLAYGFKSCSDKYKRRPQDKYVASWPQALKCWKAGGKVTKALGIDAGEAHRAGIEHDRRYRYVYPLIDWGWGRPECVAAIGRAGLPVPPKSACYFCPASKKHEVLWLAERHPELFARAVALERNAAPNLQTVRGLGRRWSWEDLAAGRLTLPMAAEPPDVGCLCFDGGED
jgi:hypothetical protein